jgi:glycosyltransferase involved in cell wall biosynthesis
MMSAGVQVVLLGRKSEQAFDAAFMQRVDAGLRSGQLRLTQTPDSHNRFVSESLVAPSLRRKYGVKALLSPNYFTPPYCDRLVTLTSILDLQYVHYPQFFSSRKRAWLQFAHRMTLRTADVVTVISEFVRDDLLNRYGSQFEEKVQVVPIGISWSRFDQAVRPSILGQRSAPFILSVASHYDHKNLVTLLRAFATLRGKIPHDLVLVGQRKENLIGVRQSRAASLEDLAVELGVADRVVFTGHSTDETVAWCYKHSDLFVFPSLFEGFGMPVVEAIGMGVPVITTRCGSLPEVTRGFATLVASPTDHEELASEIVRNLESRVSEQQLSNAAQSIREHFGPERIAAQYVDLFDR